MNKNLYRGRIVGAHTGIYALDWFFGDLVQELSTGRKFIVDLREFDETSLLSDVMVEVEPYSVGQCSGILDVVGHPIFEGDFVKYTSMQPFDGSDFFGLVGFFGGCYTATGKNSGIDLNVDNWYQFEVLGNRTDNPEMWVGLWQ
jgi:hypothetical protein